MAMSVNPAIEGYPSYVIGALRPRRNDRASIHGSHPGQRPSVPRKQAVHMTATGRTLHTRENLLPAGGHPHMTARLFDLDTAPMYPL
jgi:hypothetical protein